MSKYQKEWDLLNSYFSSRSLLDAPRLSNDFKKAVDFKVARWEREIEKLFERARNGK